jgi:hypothetical protein
MRLSEAVRIGGKLALGIGFVVTNLVMGNSLNYYYGYSSANFGAAQSIDALGSQNVTFTPQVSMVSSQIQSQDSNSSSASTASTTGASVDSLSTGNYSLLASVYGYSAPAVAQAQTYTPVSTSNYSDTWAPVAVTATVTASARLASTWNPVPPSTTANQQYQTSSFSSAYPTTQSAALIGGWYSVPVPPPPASGDIYGIVYGGYVAPPLSTSSWQSVTSTVVPTVVSQISAPTVPSYGGPVIPQTVSLGDPGIQLISPEPGTWLSMTAGLGLLALRLRRRK